LVMACRPTTAASRAGVAPNTVKELPGGVGQLVLPAETHVDVDLVLSTDYLDPAAIQNVVLILFYEGKTG
jgi:hypothetical protein